jgi:hypothetical protein
MDLSQILSWLYSEEEYVDAYQLLNAANDLFMGLLPKL